MAEIVHSNARALHEGLVGDGPDPVPATARFLAPCGLPLFVPAELAADIRDGYLRLPPSSHGKAETRVGR